MPDGERPFITVVICAYNEEELLPYSLEGMANLVYPRDRFEVLICDDGSTDRTAEIVERFIEGLRDGGLQMRLLSLEHVGLSGARNAGIQHARGEIVAYVDADAVASPTWLDELAERFVAGADYVGGRIALWNVNSWVAQYLQRTRHHQIFGPEVFKEDLIGCNMAYRKRIFEEVGGFQENFFSRGDEVSLRKRIPARYRFDVAPEAAVLHYRPESAWDALRIEWFSQKNGALVRKATGQRLGLKDLLGYGEKILMALLPLLLLAAPFSGPLAWLALFSALALGRRMFVEQEARIVFGALVEHYGAMRGFLAHLVYHYLRAVLAAAGLPVSVFVHRSAVIAAPGTTPPVVVRSVQSWART